ncbi:MAG: helix-turn-helix domain-containing protein, partial [Gammaproteobacteria bacterium]
DLDDRKLRITVRQALRYINNAIRLAARPDWYFDWVGGLSDHFHGPMSIALSSSPTLGDGIDAFVRYFPSRIPYMHMEGREHEERCIVELAPLIPLGAATPVLVETPLLILVRYLESVYDVNIADATVELAYPPTAYVDCYRQHFRCEVRFDAAHHALTIPAAWRGRSNLGYIESSWAHAVAQCEAMMGSSRERETLGDVRAMLCRAFERPDRERPLPTLAEIADGLHVAPRTLIRRLRGLGTTYQQIVDDFLLARARELLENEELTVKQVAAALGFDNPANFGKAFKRWSGQSPGNYRKGRSGSADA